jgi:hypothetical protein
VKMRATAWIRELLLRELMLEWIEQELRTAPSWTRGILASLQRKVADERVKVRRELHRHAIFVVGMEWRPWDVLVQYKVQGKLKQMPYMLAMLQAEAEGRLRQIGVSGQEAQSFPPGRQGLKPSDPTHEE